MEHVLYEYHLNMVDFLPNIIPLIVGIAFLCNSISLIHKKKEENKWERFNDFFFKIIGFIVGPLCFIICFLSTGSMIVEHFQIEKMISSGDYLEVKGEVEKFHPMPQGGHDSEHFEVDGIYFEYSSAEVMLGYHADASSNGMIQRNGQYVKIFYFVDDQERNRMIYISQIE